MKLSSTLAGSKVLTVIAALAPQKAAVSEPSVCLETLTFEPQLERCEQGSSYYPV